MGKRWLPLEANPDVMNEFCSRLGMDISKVSCVDVFGLDEELLCMVPQPVLALLMLFPITDASEAAQREEEARVADQGQIVSEKLYYMKQTIGNACGTIGLLHAIGNNRDTIPLKEGSFLSSFFSCTQGLDPQQRGQFLENPPENAPDIEDAHKDAAEQGATAPPSADEDVNLHFIAFVCKEGHLYELDGRKARPINHGPSSEATLLSDAVAVVRQFVARSNSIQFNLIALSALS